MEKSRKVIKRKKPSKKICRSLSHHESHTPYVLKYTSQTALNFGSFCLFVVSPPIRLAVHKEESKVSEVVNLTDYRWKKRLM